MMRLLWLVAGALCVLWVSAQAATVQLADVRIPSDAASIRRGAGTITSVCMTCHSLKYIKYSNLLSLGVDRDTLNLWKGDKDLNTSLTSLTPDDMARASFGKVPPDLSLITAAREGGGRYVYSLLTGFYSTTGGNTGNHIFPGIVMPDVLGYSFATDQAERRQIAQTASDAAAFLEWAAEPNAGFRKKLGTGVILYLVILTALLYLWKRRIWKDVDHGIIKGINTASASGMDSGVKES